MAGGASRRGLGGRCPAERGTGGRCRGPRRGLEPQDRLPGQLAFGFGAPLAAGQVAFAIPVEPGQAVGGALVPGARVDVVAVPNSLKTQVSGADSPSAVVLGQGLVVLTIRTPEGKTLDDEPASDSARVVIPPKLGSVIVAIPAARLPEFAEAAMASTFYLALSPAVAP